MGSDVLEKRKRLVVYTALFGGYDCLRDPSKSFKGCDFVCFTDQKHLKSDVWEIRFVGECDLTNNMMNRRYKMLPHLYFPEYDNSLYVDANIIILRSPFFLVEKYLLNFHFSVPKHFSRNCLYDESEVVVKTGKAKLSDVNLQMDVYKADFFPKDFGLSENNILLRKHNSPSVIALMNRWWGEVNYYTKRDQLSLMYCLWKERTPFTYMDETSRDDFYFMLLKHRGKYASVYNLKRYKLFLTLYRVAKKIKNKIRR